MFDIITIGSAIKDVYLRSRNFRIVKDPKLKTGLGIHLSFGSKIDLHNITFETGGGGTNTAVGFARLGLRTAFFGKIGDDSAGRHILEVLNHEKVKSLAKIIKKCNTTECHTGYSTVLSSPKGERTILSYKGASNLIEAKDVPFRSFKTKWFYMSHLSGKSSKVLPKILDFTKKNKIKTAFNPGSTQLRLGIERLSAMLNNVDVLFVNREEASTLVNVPYKDEKRIFAKLDKHVGGIVVMTEGKKGAMVSDGSHVYKAPAYKSEVIDTLGAGDAFGSGFTAGIITKNNIEYAIKLGSLNASSVIRHIGAKEGLLRNNELAGFERKLGKLKITKIALM